MRLREVIRAQPFGWCFTMAAVLLAVTSVLRNAPDEQVLLRSELAALLTFFAVSGVTLMAVRSFSVGRDLRDGWWPISCLGLGFLLLLIPIPMCFAANRSFTGRADLLYVFSVAGPFVGWLITRNLDWYRDYVVAKLIERELMENRAHRIPGAGAQRTSNEGQIFTASVPFSESRVQPIVESSPVPSHSDRVCRITWLNARWLRHRHSVTAS